MVSRTVLPAASKLRPIPSAVVAAFLAAPVAAHYAEAEPHQCAEERDHDRVEPQWPREVEEEEVEAHVLGVLDDEYLEHGQAAERRDAAPGETAARAVRLRLVHDVPLGPMGAILARE